MTYLGILLVGIAAFAFYLAFIHVWIISVLYVRVYFKGGIVKGYTVYIKGLLVALCIMIGTAAIFAINDLQLLA